MIKVIRLLNKKELLMYQIMQPDHQQIYETQVKTSTVPQQIFLAGSIEMGQAKLWQNEAAHLINKLVKQDVAKNHLALLPTLIFYNPRRQHNFAPETVASQIKWEQERLRQADYIFMYLQTGTKSPISLLEFGEFMATGKMVVSCASDFYRYQNIKITANCMGQSANLTTTKIAGCQLLAHKISLSNQAR